MTSDRRRVQEKVAKILARYQKKIVQAIRDGVTPDYRALFDDLRAALGPEIAAITTQEALRVMAETGISMDIAVINEEAVRWAREHAADAIRKMEETTRRLVEQATATYFETPGMTMGDLTRLIEPATNPVRAEMIATTEVTRAASQATNINQAELAKAGIEMRRIWHTNHDALVCEICGPLNGLPEEDWKFMFDQGPPAHPNCRCKTGLSSRDVEEHRARAAELAKEREAILRRESRKPGAIAKPKLDIARTLSEANDQTISQERVLEHIMATNPPEQVAKGQMTAQEWAKKYMTDESKGFTLVDMHPKAAYLPIEAGDPAKVRTYTSQAGKTAPPIVLDSNQKIQARWGGGRLDRAYGSQPYTVLDGKHRVEAALARGDDSISAFVPKSKLDVVWANSHAIELEQWAIEYFDSKGYTVISRQGNGFLVDKKGKQQLYLPHGLERIARNLGHIWKWGK